MLRVMRKGLLGLIGAGAVLASPAAMARTADRMADELPACRNVDHARDRLVRALHALVHRADHAVVLFLLAWVIIKFRASANPVPSRTSHNTLIEVIWTVGPVVILLFLAIPSFQLLTAQVHAAGGAEPHDQGHRQPVELGLRVSARGAGLVQLGAADRRDPRRFRKEDKAVYPRLLAVDNEIVVPVNPPSACS